MKIETIQIVNKIVHIKSSGVEKIDFTTRGAENRAAEWLKYAEKYASTNGFKLFNIEGNRITLLKD